MSNGGMTVEELEQRMGQLSMTLGKMELALNNIDQAIVWTDSRGRIQWCSKFFDKFLGASHLELIGSELWKHLTLYKEGKLISEQEHPVILVSHYGKWIDDTYEYRKGTNTLRLEIHGRHFQYQKGELSAVFVLMDITRKLMLEERLLEARKFESIGSLAAGVAHEINTPIQYIGDNLHFLNQEVGQLLNFGVSFREWVEGGMGAEEVMKKAEEYMKGMDLGFLREEIPKAITQSIEGVDHVSNIVRSVKEFSHPSSGNKVAMDVNHTLKNAVTISENQWKYYATVEMQLEVNLPLIYCDPSEVSQVFLNIIVNAVHAIEDVVTKSEEKQLGKITIRSRAVEKGVEVRIRDSGTGIPEGVRDRIFNPFFTTKEVGKGTGQGLSIVKNIVTEKHKGTIDFETEVGKGTEFIVWLPIGSESEKQMM